MKAQKQKELEFYIKKKEELELKLFFVKKEIQLTDYIIDIIEKEKVYTIGNNNDSNNP